jgi:hypothetical protein
MRQLTNRSWVALLEVAKGNNCHNFLKDKGHASINPGSVALATAIMRPDTLFAVLDVDHLLAVVRAARRANLVSRLVLVAVIAADEVGER